MANDPKAPTLVPTFLELTPPRDTEDRQPTLANFVNISGDGDLFTLDFYYVHPAKVDRIFQGRETGPETTRFADTVQIRSEPVARIAIPLTTATEVIMEMVSKVSAGVPHLRDALAEFSTKLNSIATSAETASRNTLR